MLQIERFQLISDYDWSNPNFQLRPGGTWIQPDCTCFIERIYCTKDAEIGIYIGFPDDMTKWNDYDYVCVLDEDFCQPYTPFYDLLDGKPIDFPFLSRIVDEYNNFMNCQPFLQKIKN